MYVGHGGAHTETKIRFHIPVRQLLLSSQATYHKGFLLPIPMRVGPHSLFFPGAGGELFVDISQKIKGLGTLLGFLEPILHPWEAGGLGQGYEALGTFPACTMPL